MICALCGAEWDKYPFGYRLCHIENSCPLSGLEVGDKDDAEAISKAIEAAKKQGSDEATKVFVEMIGDQRLNLIDLLQQLALFLQATIEADTPMMTEFGISCAEKPGVMIRLWASKGQTPVERVVELKQELEAAKVDTRKPEECMYYRDPLKNDSFCLLEARRECQCPCAAWRKEKG